MWDGLLDALSVVAAGAALLLIGFGLLVAQTDAAPGVGLILVGVLLAGLSRTRQHRWPDY